MEQGQAKKITEQLKRSKQRSLPKHETTAYKKTGYC